MDGDPALELKQPFFLLLCLCISLSPEVFPEPARGNDVIFLS